MDASNITYVGESEGTVSALAAPAGCVPVQQLHPRANGDGPSVVPAPPRTSREAVDSGRCVKPGCIGLKQRGFHFCAPHRLQDERAKAGFKTRAARQAEQVAADGNIAEH